ncbi:MAG: alkaline phosphatase family protein, partial [Acidobacteria bacterium]|nr:alkaline phosphatase family protein [Acidobacteriota bacterium]
MTRARAILAAGLILPAAYLSLSFHHLEPKLVFRVVDYPLLRTQPKLVHSGWSFLPLGLARLSEYPSEGLKLRVDLTGASAARSREGAKVEVEAELTYSIPPDRVLDLHRLRGPDYEKNWLSSAVKSRTAERIASVSYDLVRNRDPELAGGVRGALKEDASKEGLQVGSLRILQVAGVGEASGEILRASTAPLAKRIVLLGVDSFDWRIIDPLLKQGKMPNVARLIARGTRANLRTLRPILSPVIWTSIATGVKPSRHGIVD